MGPLRKIFFTGMLVSFLGSLPLGTLNVAAMQISVTEGILPALYFSAGSLLADVCYVRRSLGAMYWIRQQEKLSSMLEYLPLLVERALAASSFYAALHPPVQRKVVLSSSMPKFALGLMMSAI